MTGIHDAIVVGGGPAGAALARRLALAGRDVVLLERETGPHDKVCGEFLSREAILYLRELMIEPAELGAVPIQVIVLSAGGKPATCRLPFQALSLSRRRLDERLIEAAQEAGATGRRGARVKSLERSDGGWTAKLEDGDIVSGREAFLATGKHDLKGRKRPPGGQDDLIGFKLHLRLAAPPTAALKSKVEIALFPGGYAGLELIEEDRANLCLVVRKSSYAALGQRWDALRELVRSACPHLSRYLRQAEPVQERPLAIAAIPYGLVQRRTDGVWRLGDQAAVIPSFAGEGLSIALHSARLAADFYLGGKTADVFQRQLAADVAVQVRRAALLSRLLVGPYSQKAIAGCARLVPHALGQAALLTRIRPAALSPAGLAPHAVAAGTRHLPSQPRVDPPGLRL